MNTLMRMQCRLSFRRVYGGHAVLGAFRAPRPQTFSTNRRPGNQENGACQDDDSPRDVNPRAQVSSVAGSIPHHIPSLHGIPAANAKPGGWAPTVAHESGELKFTVIRVSPGGEVPMHYHHEVWDYFVPLQGEGVIEVATESGRVEKYPMGEHSFMAMPPKIIHRVHNTSSEAPFVFLIAQTPRTKYNFVAR